MERISIKKQLKNNLVALISLVVAIAALSYTAWREETTEKNRTLRMASFEMLKNLGELQVIVNHAYYQHDKMRGNPYEGWGRILLIRDLSELLPKPIQKHTEELQLAWQNNANNIDKSSEAVSQISHEIDANRDSILDFIRYLR